MKLRVAITTGVTALALAAPAAAAPGWLPPFALGPGNDVRTGMAPDGTAFFAWTAPDNSLQLRVRPPNGALGPAQTVTPPAETVNSSFRIHVTANGIAALIWTDAATAVRTRSRLPDGTFDDVRTLSEAGEGATGDDMALDSAPNGDVTFAWHRYNAPAPPDHRIRTRRRFADGALEGAVDDVSTGALNAFEPGVAVDAGGNAVYVYRVDSAGVSTRVRSAEGVFNGQAAVGGGLEPRVGVDPAGNATYVYREGPGIGTRYRHAGTGVFEPATALTTKLAQNQEVEVAGDGTARFVWSERPNVGDELQAHMRTRSAAGGFGTTSPLSVFGQSVIGAQLAANEAGDAIVTWSPGPAGGAEGRAALVTGGLQPLAVIGGAGTPAGRVTAAIDARGNGAAAWSQGDQASAAGFDRPLVTSLRVPATAERGVSVPMTAAAAGIWNPLTIRFDFGDKKTATGGSVAHRFERTGRFTVTATAGDTAGFNGAASSTVVVRDTRRPRVTKLRMVRKRFRAGRRNGFRFRLSEPAGVRITVQRRVGGKRKYKTLGSITRRNLQAGARRVSFTRRIGRKRLRVGRYRALLVATDPSRNRSRTAKVAFRVVR